MEVTQRMKTQRAEFDACRALSEAYRCVANTAVVDDDYPAVRADYERALRELLDACEANGRRAATTPLLVVTLLRRAAHLALEYDRAIEACGKMTSHCTAEGDDLDSLYGRWISAACEALQADYDPSRPLVVCLCGSTKFKDEFAAANMRETLLGKIVLSVGSFMHADQVPLTREQKVVLDALHKKKIDAADEVLVLNVGGYIGDSTRSEIEHAQKTDKPVRYLEPIA